MTLTNSVIARMSLIAKHAGETGSWAPRKGRIAKVGFCRWGWREIARLVGTHGCDGFEASHWEQALVTEDLMEVWRGGDLLRPGKVSEGK